MALPEEFSSYKTMNLDEALTQEKISHDFSKYKETDDQVVIYLFRGNGCGFCRNFLTFLNSIIGEYGKYFKVVSFEVWYDQDNVNLMNDVASVLNTTVDGVPFIVIGNTVIPGYNKDYDNQIKQAIEKEYKNKNRYDVFEELLKNPPQNNGNNQTGDNAYSTSGSNTSSMLLIILCNLIFVTLGVVIILSVVTNKHNELMDYIEELEEKLSINSKVKTKGKE